MTWRKPHGPSPEQVQAASHEEQQEFDRALLHEFRELNRTLKHILGVLREKPKPTIVGHFGPPRPGTTP
jgi:hypothetical protein